MTTADIDVHIGGTIAAGDSLAAASRAMQQRVADFSGQLKVQMHDWLGDAAIVAQAELDRCNQAFQALTVTCERTGSAIRTIAERTAITDKNVSGLFNQA